jgi:hypothetical protein
MIDFDIIRLAYKNFFFFMKNFFFYKEGENNLLNFSFY